MPTIGKRRRQARCSTHTYRVPFRDMTDNLHIGIFVINLVDIIESTAVDVLIRKLIQHIERGFYPELFTKNVGTLSADTLTKFYVLNG